MKKIKLLSFFVLLLFASRSLLAEEHNHQHESGVSNSKNQSNKKFVADSNLQSRMQKISALLGDPSDPKSAIKSDDAQSSKEVGIAIEKAVGEIFSTCKLEPSADAAIHPILAQILSGADLLKNGKASEGAEKVHGAFQKYHAKFTPSANQAK